MCLRCGVFCRTECTGIMRICVLEVMLSHLSCINVYKCIRSMSGSEDN